MRLFYYKLWAEEKPPAVVLHEAQLAVYRCPDQIGKLATLRGPAFNEVVQVVTDAEKRSSASDIEQIRRWAAFVLSGPGR